MNFDNQTNIFNPEEAKSNIFIAGVGSVGSFTALTLAKMGFQKITCVDFDKIEEKNIPNQFYRIKDVDEHKIIALKEIILDFTDTEIDARETEITADTDLLNYYNIDLNTIFILAVDSIEARKLIYDKIKDLPIKLLDARMGGEGYQIYAVNLNNDTEKEKYEKTLNLETSDAPCGQKSIIYTILSIASEMCNIVKKMEVGQDFPRTLKREMTTYRFISDRK